MHTVWHLLWKALLAPSEASLCSLSQADSQAFTPVRLDTCGAAIWELKIHPCGPCKSRMQTSGICSQIISSVKMPLVYPVGHVNYLGFNNSLLGVIFLNILLPDARGMLCAHGKMTPLLPELKDYPWWWWPRVSHVNCSDGKSLSHGVLCVSLLFYFIFLGHGKGWAAGMCSVHSWQLSTQCRKFSSVAFCGFE